MPKPKVKVKLPGLPYFEIHEKNGQWYWRLWAGMNNDPQIVADGGGYNSRSGCMRAVSRLRYIAQKAHWNRRILSLADGTHKAI